MNLSPGGAVTVCRVMMVIPIHVGVMIPVLEGTVLERPRPRADVDAPRGHFVAHYRRYNASHRTLSRLHWGEPD